MVTTSSQDNGGSSWREMARSYPTRWDRELASADLVATRPLFLGGTGWRMPHPFRRTSRGAPDLFVPGAQQLSTEVWIQSIKRVTSTPRPMNGRLALMVIRTIRFTVKGLWCSH